MSPIFGKATPCIAFQFQNVDDNHHRYEFNSVIAIAMNITDNSERAQFVMKEVRPKYNEMVDGRYQP